MATKPLSVLSSYSGTGPVRGGISDSGEVPVYYLAKVKILARIAGTDPGYPLPSERELSQHLEISRVTVRRAIAELIMEGRLIQRHGDGTYVGEPKRVLPFWLRANADCVSTQDRSRFDRELLCQERQAPGPDLAAELGLAPDEKVICFETVLLAAGELIGLETSYIPEAHIRKGFDGASLVDWRTTFDNDATDTEQQIETIFASPREASLLGSIPSLPMLLVHRTSRDGDGSVLGSTRTILRGDRVILAHRTDSPTS